MKKLTFQQLLDKTKRVQYTDKEVVDSVKPHKPQEIEFFNVAKYTYNDELEEEYRSRGLLPANPYALTLYLLDNEDKLDEMKYFATHWKDSNNEWCYIAFNQWDGGGRSVDVNHDDDDWDDDWWFAGVRKYQKELGDLDTLPQSSELGNLEKRIEKIENWIKSYTKI